MLQNYYASKTASEASMTTIPKMVLLVATSALFPTLQCRLASGNSSRKATIIIIIPATKAKTFFISQTSSDVDSLSISPSR